MKTIKIAPVFLLVFLVSCQKQASVSNAAPTPTTSISEPCLKFFVVSDYGDYGSKNQLAVAKQMGKVAEENKIDFVISAGDSFHREKVWSAEDPLWETRFEKIYDAPSLQVPWYCCLGNHDYYGNVLAQMEYSRKHPRRILPARFYAVEKKIDFQTKVAFVFLDTSMMFDNFYQEKKSRLNLMGWDKTKQMKWLDKTLDRTRADWKIVIGHHPVYSAYHDVRQAMREEMIPRLEKYGVDAYFSGHEHDLQHTRVGKINFFVSGAGAVPRKGKEIKNPNTLFLKQDTLGFLLVAISANQMEAQFVDDEGNVLYKTIINNADTKSGA